MPVQTRKGLLTEIHVTDRRIFKECRNKYRFQILDRLATKDSRVDALFIGVGGHHVLAEHYKALMEESKPIDMVDAFQQWLYNKAEEVNARQGRFEWPDGETLEMIHGILRGYQEHYADKDGDWKVLAVETNMKAKIPGTNVTLTGTVDLVVKWHGSIWIVDHKFLRSISDSLAPQLEMDDQMTAYLWLASQNGIQARGCIYNVIRKKLPTVPEILKSGALSKNKSIDTTQATYLKAIHDNGLNPEDYVDILDALGVKPNNFFHREPVARNRRELQFFQDDLTYEARDMTSKNTRYYPTPGMSCGWCQFRSLCKGEREGADVEYTVQHLYRIRDDDER